MANAKQVRIKGSLPFDLGDMNPELMKYINNFMRPSFGLRWCWEGCNLCSNHDGSNGQTMVYDFTITGVESLNLLFFVKMAKTIQSIPYGKIDYMLITDIDANIIVFDLTTASCQRVLEIQ